MSPQRIFSFLPAVLCMAAIFWFSSQPGDEVARAAQPLYQSAPTVGNTGMRIPWLKVGHVVGYGALGAALLYGFGPGRRRSVALSLAVTLLYAAPDEFHQSFTPGRSAGITDVLIDLGAAGAAVFVITLIARFSWKRS